MIHDSDNSIKPEYAFADFGVAIFSAPERIHTVVEVKRLDAIEPDETIKLVQNAVKIIDNIVTCVVHMATVHTDADLIP